MRCKANQDGQCPASYGVNPAGRLICWHELERTDRRILERTMKKSERVSGDNRWLSENPNRSCRVRDATPHDRAAYWMMHKYDIIPPGAPPPPQGYCGVIAVRIGLNAHDQWYAGRFLFGESVDDVRVVQSMPDEAVILAYNTLFPKLAWLGDA